MTLRNCFFTQCNHIIVLFWGGILRRTCFSQDTVPTQCTSRSTQATDSAYAEVTSESRRLAHFGIQSLFSTFTTVFRLAILTNMDFDTYSMPDPSTTFSVPFFNRLTFQQVSHLRYPTIAPVGAVVQWTFVGDVPIVDATLCVDADETVPHALDILPICQQMEEAFLRGSRSVVIHMRVQEKDMFSLYHFSKVNAGLLCYVMNKLNLDSTDTRNHTSQ